MGKKIDVRVFGGTLGAALLAFLLTPRIASAQPHLGNNLYLEAKTDLQLFAPSVLSNGDRALAPKILLPEESIIAVDVRQISGALEAMKTHPERVNFPFVSSSQTTVIERNDKGWLCGLRVVDAVDEDLRETTEIERGDFCLPADQITHLQSLAGQPNSAGAAFTKFIENQDRTLLNSLAQSIQQNEMRNANEGLLLPVADLAQQIISPLRDCGPGCLEATSEFGMRKHPVLKKRRLHKGIDLRAKIGSPVVSVLDGTVLANRTEFGRGKGKKGRKKSVMKGYGHYVIVVHPEANIETLYAHLSEFRAEAGAKVAQGALIALSGNTGIGTAPHLHFETHIANDKGGYKPVNPRDFISSLFESMASLIKMFHLTT